MCEMGGESIKEKTSVQRQRKENMKTTVQLFLQGDKSEGGTVSFDFGMC